MKRIIIRIVTIVLVVSSLSACGTTNQRNDKYSIITTTFAQYDWIKEILGDKIDEVELALLLDSGVDLHSFQPSVEDIAKISESDMFVYVGGESDNWVTDILETVENKDMTVINMMEVLGDKVKEEEIVEGMIDSHDHDHSEDGVFEDSEVSDRELSDWAGDWQSVYPYLEDGTLDQVMEEKANENDGMSKEDYLSYYQIGYQTDINRIVIEEDGTISFYQEDTQSKTIYSYDGYEILTYESGLKGVRYLFSTEETEGTAPKYIQFSDHGIGPEDSEHFHIFMGDTSHEELLKEMDNWPTYYHSDLTNETLVEEMISHDHSEEEINDEHIWLSLKNAEILIEDIAVKLSYLMPENNEVIQENMEEYLTGIRDLDKQYQEVVNKGDDKTLIFGDRFAFRYLVDDYGLDYYAAFSGCSAETEASFDTVVFLANKLDELKLNNIMVLEDSNQKLANTIVENTTDKNQEILVLNSMQSTGNEEVGSGATYLTIMEDNLIVLEQALK